MGMLSCSIVESLGFHLLSFPESFHAYPSLQLLGGEDFSQDLLAMVCRISLVPGLLVVSTHLRNVSQNGNLPQIGVKIKNISNHHLVLHDVYIQFIIHFS